MKKALSILLAFVIMFSVISVSLVSNALETSNEDSGVMPCFTTINSYSTILEISGLTASASATLVSGYATNLKIIIQLQKSTSSGYETVEMWTASKTSGVSLALSESKIINPLNDYRIRVTFVAGSETHVAYDYP